jgi:cytochrome c oxidase assembly protein subunit 15
MVVVGGATRLTGSGLSITEWQPILGVVPPMSEADWREAFEKYRQIPQYAQVNRGMSLDGFKAIYWWERAHRLLGRLIGFAFIVPFAIFLARGSIPRHFIPRIAGLFLLGAAQGGLGWFMVKSGLETRVDVSQYRLAAHLALAVAIGGYAFWLALSMRASDASALREGRSPSPQPSSHGRGGSVAAIAVSFPLPEGEGQGEGRFARHQRAVFGAAALAALVYLQIIAGAFVAGLKAGHASDTWPLMNGEIIPPGLGAYSPWYLNLFENPLTAQFTHRMLAYATAIFAAAFAALAWRKAPALRLPLLVLLGAILIQIALGIATIVYGVPLALALAHQANAIAVFALALWTLRRATPRQAPDRGRQ